MNRYYMNRYAEGGEAETSEAQSMPQNEVIYNPTWFEEQQPFQLNFNQQGQQGYAEEPAVVEESVAAPIKEFNEQTSEELLDMITELNLKMEEYRALKAEAEKPVDAEQENMVLENPDNSPVDYVSYRNYMKNPEAFKESLGFTPQPSNRVAYTGTGGTDVASSLNNPGNILYNPAFKKFGAIQSNRRATDSGKPFAAFPNVEAGLKAREAQLFGEVDKTFPSKYYKPNTSVDEALRMWSGRGYGVNIYPELKGKTLAQVTPAERKELMKRQIKQESNQMYKYLTTNGYLKFGGTGKTVLNQPDFSTVEMAYKNFDDLTPEQQYYLTQNYN